MDFKDIFKQLIALFREILEDEQLVITPESSAKDIEAWDSLTHIHIIVAVEQQYKIKFTTAEMKGMKTIGDMANLIVNKVIP